MAVAVDVFTSDLCRLASYVANTVVAADVLPRFDGFCYRTGSKTHRFDKATFVSSNAWPAAMRQSLMVLAVFVAGCSSFSTMSNPFADIGNPFSQQEPAYKSQYGPTPAQKANRLRQLAQVAGSLSAEEQTEISNELYELYSATSDPILRREAVRAMGAFPVPIAAAGLQAATEDAESSVRIAACEAWRLRGGPEAVAALSGLLQNDADVDVRLAASSAIATFPTELAVPQLGRVLEDRDPAVQVAVLEALRSNSNEDFGNDVSRWTQYAMQFESPELDPSSSGPPMIAEPLDFSTTTR